MSMRYKLLGRSGLRVSELCLGTMNFGEAWGFGADEKESNGSSARSPRRAATSSTPPTPTTPGSRRRSSAASSAPDATAGGSPEAANPGNA
jgi:hypothetical protein